MPPDGQVIDTVTPRHGNSTVNDCNKRAEPVWNPEAHPGAWRSVWAYSAKRARRDQKRWSPRKPGREPSSTAQNRPRPPGS